MGTLVSPIRSGTMPLLSDLAIQLVETIDNPELSYQHAWRVIRKMAREMRKQTLVPVHATVDDLLTEDKMADESMYQLLHTIHPRVLRSVCMGTVAYDFHDELSSLWMEAVHSQYGPGAYAVGISIENRDGKFLTGNEIRELIGHLQTYTAGCDAWAARGGDEAYGNSQLDGQQTDDLACAMAIDDQYVPRGLVTPSSEMHFDMADDEEEKEEEEDDAVPDSNIETDEDESQEVHRPRFASSGRDMTKGIHALIAMFERRLLDGANMDEPHLQSPLIIGNSNDLQKRKQDYRPNVTRLHSAAHVYSLLMCCIKYMDLEPEEVFVPFTKAWAVGQINQGEVLGTIVGYSLVSMAGLNVHPPGTKNKKRNPADSVFKKTRRDVTRREWFLDNIRHTCAQSEHGQLQKLYEEIMSVTNDDLAAAKSSAETARNDFSSAILEAERALSDKRTELAEAKTALVDTKTWQKKAGALDDELFDGMP